MARVVSKGTCAFCGQSFAKNTIGRHLAKCEARAAAEEAPSKSRKKARIAQLTHLVVDTPYPSPYWLHIEIPGDATLKHLDQFLRDIWLECCGHLSAFKVDNTSYVVHEDVMIGADFMGQFFDEFMASLGPEHREHIRPPRVEKTMVSSRIDEVFQPDVVVDYEYDFGSTTALRLRYVSTRTATVSGHTVQLLARNEPPVIPCEVCDDPATVICTMCGWGGTWLCDRHASEHECGTDYMLPVVNSPRAGVCGYTG